MTNLPGQFRIGFSFHLAAIPSKVIIPGNNERGAEEGFLENRILDRSQFGGEGTNRHPFFHFQVMTKARDSTCAPRSDLNRVGLHEFVRLIREKSKARRNCSGELRRNLWFSLTL